jgi:chemotaxis signal transduction protein
MQMITEERVNREEEVAADSPWCYLVSLGGSLFALPDDDSTVLLPFISSIPQVTPLPKGLVPPYVMGLINVAQRGELLIDLPRMLGLRSGPAAPSMVESRRVVVVGEADPPDAGEYRLAFAVDYGYELFQVGERSPTTSHPLGAYVGMMLETPHGEAALLDMEAVCNAVLREMGAERLWNEAAAKPEADDL